MPPWCHGTSLFCIGWWRNVKRFITRAEPLYDSLNPLFCVVFPADVVCARSLLLWSIKVKMSTYQCTVCLSICDLNLEVIEKFQRRRIVIFHTRKTLPGKRLYHLPQKFPEIRPGIFGRMVSAMTYLRSKTTKAKKLHKGVLLCGRIK